MPEELTEVWQAFARLQGTVSREHSPDFDEAMAKGMDFFLNRYVTKGDSFDPNAARLSTWMNSRGRLLLIASRFRLYCANLDRIHRGVSPDPSAEAALREQVAAVKKLLTDEDWNLLIAYVEGDGPSLAQQLGVSRQRVHQRAKAIIRRLRALLGVAEPAPRPEPESAWQATLPVPTIAETSLKEDEVHSAVNGDLQRA